MCYAVSGTASTLVGGPLSGVILLLPPIERKGVTYMVTWPDLIVFSSFLVTLIALIIGIIDHNK